MKVLRTEAGRRGRAWASRAVLLAVVFFSIATLGAQAAETNSPIDVYFFRSAECPHCVKMQQTLDVILAGQTDVELHEFEVSDDAHGAKVFARVVAALGLSAAVPIVVVGETVRVGHHSGSGEDVRQLIAHCRVSRCTDVVEPLLGTAALLQPPPAAPSSRVTIPQSIDVPLFGDVRTAALSLPLLTIAMAAIDGFNPCAMWVLVFLIGLLLGIADRRRMWLLAAVFLLATAAVYFMVLAAWLNLLMVLGAVVWVRLAIGVVAMAAGGFNLRAGLRHEQVCEITRPERRRRIFEHLRRHIEEPGLGSAIAGVTLLAVAVNFVELLCSAGVPAVYTALLAQAQLAPAAYYGYLVLYILVFLADDALVVIVAMTTLRMVSWDGRYSRWVRLAGGVVMIVLGALLIVKPEWLAFAV